jgi:hypothetical protein
MYRINRIRWIRYHSGRSLFSFLAFLEYFFDLLPPLDKAGKQGEFALQKEHHARDKRICH